jgi:hypothetical protein
MPYIDAFLNENHNLTIILSAKIICLTRSFSSWRPLDGGHLFPLFYLSSHVKSNRLAQLLVIKLSKSYIFITLGRVSEGMEKLSEQIDRKTTEQNKTG